MVICKPFFVTLLWVNFVLKLIFHLLRSISHNIIGLSFHQMCFLMLHTLQQGRTPDIADGTGLTTVLRPIGQLEMDWHPFVSHPIDVLDHVLGHLLPCLELLCWTFLGMPVECWMCSQREQREWVGQRVRLVGVGGGIWCGGEQSWSWYLPTRLWSEPLRQYLPSAWEARHCWGAAGRGTTQQRYDDQRTWPPAEESEGHRTSHEDSWAGTRSFPSVYHISARLLICFCFNLPEKNDKSINTLTSIYSESA